MIQTGTLLPEFLAFRGPIAELKEQAEVLLPRQDLPQVFERISQKDRDAFIEKLDQVYWNVVDKEQDLLGLFGAFFKAIGQHSPLALLTDGLTRDDTNAATSEGITDVYQGEYKGARVFIRVFRAYSAENLERAKGILLASVLAWKKLNHPNISVFYGVATEISPLALVYGWEENGNILQYTKSHQDASWLALLLQVAKALRYLHSLGIVHGNLTGVHVLISGSGQVRLTGYGLADLYADPNLTATVPIVGNERSLAPEIVDSTNAVTESKEADVFAFGMLAVEVSTGRPPFEECGDVEAPAFILRGGRPERPHDSEALGLTEEVWRLFERCWHQDPTQRITIGDVVVSLQDLLGIERAPNVPLPPEETGGHPPPRPGSRKASWWRKLSCVG